MKRIIIALICCLYFLTACSVSNIPNDEVSTPQSSVILIILPWLAFFSYTILYENISLTGFAHSFIDLLFYFSGILSTSPGRMRENRLLLFSRSSSLMEQPSLRDMFQKLSPFCTV